MIPLSQMELFLDDISYVINMIHPRYLYVD